jgi:hypothetical protein
MVSPTSSAKDPLTAEHFQVVEGIRERTVNSTEQQDSGLDRARYQSVHRGAQIKDSDPPVSREVVQSLSWTDKESLRADSQDLARKARDAFRDACESTDRDRSEMSYLAMRSSIEELWSYAKHRDAPFRDLLV